MRKNIVRFFANYSMVDISEKDVSHRTASARGKVFFSDEGFKHLVEKGSSKGDVFKMAEVAGIMAAKNTSNLLPLCHPIPINKVSVKVGYDYDSKSVVVDADAVSDAKTGVEMEALTAVSVSCLTVYDMCKNFEKNMEIRDLKLLSKEKTKI